MSGMHPNTHLARSFRERAADVSRAYARAILGEEDAVHELRVTTRRMRVAVNLLASHPRGKRARRVRKLLKRLAAAAGRSRDLDVGRPLLLKHRETLAVPGRSALVRAYRAARTRARAAGSEALLDCEVARLRRALRRLGADGLVDPPTLAKRIAGLVGGEGEKVFAATHALGPVTRSEDLHDLRRRIRRLRYASEWASELPGRNEGVFRGWRALQNALGEVQDRRMLASWLDAFARDAAPRRRPEARTVARHLAWALGTEADRLQRELFARVPETIVREGLDAMREPGPQRETGGGVPFPKVHPAITLTSG